MAYGMAVFFIDGELPHHVPCWWAMLNVVESVLPQGFLEGVRTGGCKHMFHLFHLITVRNYTS